MNRLSMLSYFGSAFLKRYRSPKIVRPAFCSIKLTERCNFRCIMCGSHLFGYVKTELTTDEWKGVIDELAQLKYLSVRFTGGEPLIRKDLLDLIEHASKHALRVAIATNGYLITKEIAKSFANLGVSRVTVSLNGLGQDHDQICGVRGAFNTIERNMNFLQETGVTCALVVTIMKETIDKIPQILESAELRNIPVSFNIVDDKMYFTKNVPGISERQLNNQARLKELIEFLKRKRKENKSLIAQSLDSLDFIPKYLMDPIQKQIPCMSSLIETLINSRGDMYGGCYILPPLGNIRNISLKDILTSPVYKERVVRTYRKQCPGCSCGYPLNSILTPTSLMREIFTDLKFLWNRVV